MRSNKLTFQHPVNQLQMFNLDTETWDCLNPPEMTLIEGNSVVPYMPYFHSIEARQTQRIEPVENGECRFFFELDRHMPELWQLFFENYRNGAKVSFDGNILILCCHPRDFSHLHNRICFEEMMKATNDYRQERDTLLWQVFLHMKKLERRERIVAQMLAELEDYKQKRQLRIAYAEEHSLSVSFLVQNFNDRYREILENKFRWWAKVLDGSFITQYRVKFESEFLPA